MKTIDQFITYFESKDHTPVGSSPLVPEGDTSVLLTTAGMQQFKPYYLGKPSPYGNRVVSVQKCVRVDDIEEVGDETHNTFFEMLGNFSFQYPDGEGSYFKREAIRYGYEFIAETLGLSIDYVTIFAGDETSPRDSESYAIWQELAQEKAIDLEIREYGREDNFWGPTGSEGPCGPTTEIYVNDVEIWNIVFNQYYFHRDGELESLEFQGVDTGGGLERILAHVERVSTVYDTSLLKGMMQMIREALPEKDESVYRMVLDHTRASLFLIADGVIPSNKEQGYVLRRLIRKVLSVLHGDETGLQIFSQVADSLRDIYAERYPELTASQDMYRSLSAEEYGLFADALKRGMKHANKILRKKRVPQISGEEAFLLSSTYGLSPEVMKLNGLAFDETEFAQKQDVHKEVSRAGVEKKFGGHGFLLDNGEVKAANEEELVAATKLHSATHLLNTALRTVFPDADINQKGSDITADRLRFDFSFDRKLTPEEFAQVQDLINQYIDAAVDVVITELPLAEAQQSGALFMPNRNYPDPVTVYAFGDISQEFCGGPHVANTRDIGRIRLKKQEAVSQGVRRIRAILE